mgnify:CR=1 FL=1
MVRQIKYYLKQLNYQSISDLIAFPSVLVNYYIGKQAEFAIYREYSQYTKKYKNDPYTRSVTPLRRFVSNINLAFFLNQNGIVSFPERDLVCIEKNIDEIIKHLNETEQIGKFIERNKSFVLKHIKH